MPSRRAVRLLPVLFAALAAAAPAPGQPASGRDTVVFLDRKEGKLVTAENTAVRKESPAGVEATVNGSPRLIPVTDLVRVDLGNLPGVAGSDLAAARRFEDAGDYPKAQGKYADLLKAAAGNPRAVRYVGYLEAAAGAKAADAQANPKEFEDEAKRAAKSLADFARANPGGWESWPAARTAARLQMELGQYADAAATLDALAKTPDLPSDLAAEARLAAAGVLLRAGRPAGPVLADLEKDGKLSAPARQRLAVLKAAAAVPPAPAGADGSAGKPAAAKGLEDAIAAASDPVAKAVGYNFLGDVLRTHGLARDSVWAYLWADVVYNGDRDERVYAVRRLAEVFDRMEGAEKDRAEQFRAKLPLVR